MVGEMRLVCAGEVHVESLPWLEGVVETGICDEHPYLTRWRPPREIVVFTGAVLTERLWTHRCHLEFLATFYFGYFCNLEFCPHPGACCLHESYLFTYTQGGFRNEVRRQQTAHLL